MRFPWKIIRQIYSGGDRSKQKRSTAIVRDSGGRTVSDSKGFVYDDELDRAVESSNALCLLPVEKIEKLNPNKLYQLIIDEMENLTK
jgi:hypothetical protein